MKHLILILIFTISGTFCALPVFSQTIKLREPNRFTNGEYKPTCKDCYIQQVEIVVPKTGKIVDGADPVCSVPKVVDFFQIAAASLRVRIDPDASGDLAEITKHFAYQEVRNKAGGSFQPFLDAKGPRTPYGNCAPLGAVLPRDAVLEEIVLGDWDDKVGAGACVPGKDCNNGGAEFLNTPEITKQVDGGQIVATTFQNWSHDRDRIARMFISYRMPAGKSVFKIE